MAEITLRDYIKFIDDRLANDANTEAIAHCRHILQTYPKHIETYNLLARALSAQENYQDALDLFQRVLSANPNDFIAHIGMSDCYRESNALDQAIWHLERTFEQVPSNSDIQEEIKRLYRERDGEAPRKVNLTGGALGRLYAKGKLYPQSVSELTKAIAADPERLDLQILLAQVLWNSRREVESGKVAAEVLKRLPFSVDANRILTQLWLRAGNANEARPFLQRVREIDPYLAVELETGQKPSDSALTLTQLDYTPERHAEEVGAADWVSELDAIEKKRGVTGPLTMPEGMADVPDWLAQIDAGPKPVDDGRIDLAQLFGADQVQDDASAAKPAEEDQPEWLKDILTGDQPEAAAAPEPVTTRMLDDNAPDWLQDLVTEEPGDSPAEPADEVKATSLLDAGVTPDWLNDSPSEATQTRQDTTPARDAAERPAPAWLQDVLSGAEPGTGAPASQQADVVSDDWLDQVLTGESTDEMPAVSATPEPAEDLSTRLFTDEDTDRARLATGQLDTWDGPLPESVTRPEEPEEEPEEDIAPPSEDWLTLDTGLGTPVLSKDKTVEEQEQDESVPDWLAQSLDDVESDEDEAEEEVEVESDASADSLPDWLTSAGAEIVTGALSRPDSDDEDEDDAMPDWLAGSSEAVVSEEKPSDDSNSEAMPDWLSGAMTAMVGDEDESSDSDDDDDEPPDWLMAAAEDEDDEQPANPADENLSEPEESQSAPDAATLEEPAREEADNVTDDNDIPDFLTDGNLDDSDAAMAWLEELAAKYDPDYVAGQAGAEPADEETPAEPVAEAVAETPADDSIPDWLTADSGEAAAPIAASDEDEDEDVPDWMKGEPAAVAAPAESSATDESIPDWLLDETEIAEEPVAVAPPAAQSGDDAMAWLDQQVAEQGADPQAVVTDQLTTDQPPVKADIDIPAPDAEAEMASDEELPDWLKEAGGRGEMEKALQAESSDDDDDLDLDLDDLPDLDVEDEELAWLTDTLEAEGVDSDLNLDDLLSDDDEEDEEPSIAAIVGGDDDDKMPDWLTGGGDTAFTPVASLADDDDDDDDEMPDWLTSTPAAVSEASDDEDEEDEEVEAPVLEESEDLPDWLGGGSSSEPETRAADAGLTDFLRAVTPASDAPSEPEPAPAASTPEPAAASAPAEPAAAPAAAPMADPAAALSAAQTAMSNGEFDTAFANYESLVASGERLHETISDLSDHVKNTPVVKPRVYRILGDALMAQGKLDDALEMYRNALDRF